MIHFDILTGAHLGIFKGKGGFQKKGTILSTKTIPCKNLKNLSSVLDIKTWLIGSMKK